MTIPHTTTPIPLSQVLFRLVFREVSVLDAFCDGRRSRSAGKYAPEVVPDLHYREIAMYAKGWQRKL
jgi:hypothetical protein